jgi:hypothetical protein
LMEYFCEVLQDYVQLLFAEGGCTQQILLPLSLRWTLLFRKILNFYFIFISALSMYLTKHGPTLQRFLNGILFLSKIHPM